MPMVRDLIQTVVIGKTPGHEPASLEVHGDIANIMASMDVSDVLQQRFITAAQNDLMARLASGEIDTEAKQNKLIEAYIDEMSRKLPEWKNLQVLLLRRPDCMESCPTWYLLGTKSERIAQDATSQKDGLPPRPHITASAPWYRWKSMPSEYPFAYARCAPPWRLARDQVREDAGHRRCVDDRR